MPWHDLEIGIAEEFREAQAHVVSRLHRVYGVKRERHRARYREKVLLDHGFVANEKKRSKARKLQALKERLRARSPIMCANTRCRVEFVPYRADTTYCTVACRKRACARRVSAAVSADTKRRARRLKLKREYYRRRKAEILAKRRTPAKASALKAYEATRTARKRAERLAARKPIACQSPLCDETFVPPSRGDQRYCCASCKWTASYQRRAA